jgi:hypothetical protein
MVEGVSPKLLAIMKKGGASVKQTEAGFDEEPWKKLIDPVDLTPKLIAPPQQDEIIVTSNVQELIPMALDVHYKIMKITRLNPTDDDYVANAKLALATAQSVLNTQIKVDENQLKVRKRDDILSVLQELRDEEKKQRAIELVLEE